MKGIMTRSLIMAGAVLVSACAAGDRPQDEPAAAPMEETDTPPAGVAGTWHVEVTNEAGDSVLTTYRLGATDSWSGWTMTFDNGQVVDLRVSQAERNGIAVEAGPYPSVLRPGVQVSTRSTMYLDGASFHGTGTARYQLADGETELPLRFTGTRQ
jgi:hypothetical protein